jgi:hypothetical protein
MTAPVVMNPRPDEPGRRASPSRVPGRAPRPRSPRPASQAAVLPDTTHVGLMRRADLVAPMAESFLRLLPFRQ